VGLLSPQLGLEFLHLLVALRGDRGHVVLQRGDLLPELVAFLAGRFERFHDLQLRLLQDPDPALEVGNLFDERGEGLGIADRPVGDAPLVAGQPFGDRLQVALGPGLLAFQVADLGVRGHQPRREHGPTSDHLRQHRVLGEGLRSMCELCNGGVHALQVEQTPLRLCVRLDDRLLPEDFAPPY
jgi:hypothetical protein